MINKNGENFKYRGGDLVYIISPLTSQLRTHSQKIAVKYVGPVVNLQNSRPSQLSTDDISWDNIERNF